MNKLSEKVKEIINQIHPISENSFIQIENILKFETYKKGDTVIQKNRNNNKEYFVLNGVCKSYLINSEGDEVIISFFLEKSILSPHSIRTSNNISYLYFQASTDLEIATMNASSFENLMITNSEIRGFANAVLQNELILKIEKEIGLASLSAKERLMKFRERYKILENIIPHTEIASYLGITNISLSRLRRDLIK
ncbi:MAG: Crp/Fnr family transcriptional regulator [Flavobacteriaceae bacterium]|nr:Crp/Fnr family transcriptional regulator [Flavobacteriaceae bacterium]